VNKARVSEEKGNFSCQLARGKTILGSSGKEKNSAK
jgi:hypothetical protein